MMDQGLANKSEVLAYNRERRIFLQRLRVVRAVCVLLVLVLAWRVGHLQLLQYENYSLAAEENRIQLQALEPQRGEIIDYHGGLLATNRMVRSVYYLAGQLKEDPQTITFLATLLDIDDNELKRLRERVEKQNSKQPLLLKSDITDKQEAALMVRGHRLPGLLMRNSYERYYPYGESFSHVIGYVGQVTKAIAGRPDFDKKRYVATDLVGRSGLEAHYEDLLQGYPGWEKVEVDVRGRVRRVISGSEPRPGKRLRLGLDAQLQSLTRNLLGDRKGAVVAIEPATGRLLVLLSNPGFDPNLFVRGLDSGTYGILMGRKDKPFFVRYSQGRYAPASTIKPFYALSLLRRKLVDPKKTIYDQGYFQIEGDKRIYHNWYRRGSGRVNLDRAIRISNDTYFFTQASLVGRQPFVDSLREFGFGGKVSIDVAYEGAGFIPTPEWKLSRFQQGWYTGDTINMSVGQGYLLVTPLQLAFATALLANRGKAVPPRLLVGVDGKEISSWENYSAPQDLSADNKWWNFVTDSMVSVMRHPEGTGARVGRGLPYRIAGKTGTAQVFTLEQDQKYDARKLRKELLDNSLFVGFAPADNPRIAIAVIIENGGSGGRAAAPLAGQVIDAHLRQNFTMLN